MNEIRAYDVDAHVAEVYDRIETGAADVALLRALLPRRSGLRVLEPFCGTGRVALPLAADGHAVTGLDRSPHMLERARAKARALPDAARALLAFRRADVLTEPWPGGFDVVLLGGNCLFELEGPAAQARVVVLAAGALRPGGFVFLDNDRMEGDLDPAWRRPPGDPRPAFPQGRCADGTWVQGTTETVSFDVPGRIVEYRRSVVVTAPDGRETRSAWTERCHPPSAGEVETWLGAAGFTVLARFGDKEGNPLTADAPRAVFWARLRFP